MERRHHQDVRRSGQAAERVLRHQVAIERDIGSHLPVIFEVDALAVEDRHGVAHLLRALAGRMAEGREGEHRDLRLIAEPAGDAGRLDRDLRQFLRRRHLGDRGVGDEHGAPARDRDRDADQAMARPVVDDAADLFQSDRVVAGDAGHHRVGVAERHHGGGEMVAVLVDQALAVAEEIAVPLQPLVEILRIGRVAVREPGVLDLDALGGEVDAQMLRGLVDALLASDQDRLAELLVDEGGGGADDLLLLALGEDDALGIAPDALEDAVERAGDGIAPGRKLRLVGAGVDDRLAGDAGVHRRLGDRHRHDMDQSRIERHRDDVVLAVARARALIGGGDLVGHILAGQHGQSFGGGDLHLHVDGGGADIERAAEDEGKAEHVVDLVRIVRAPGRHDRVVADGRDLLRRDLRIGIGHGEDDRVLRHRGDHLRRHRALLRQTEEGVGPLHRLRQRASVGDRSMGRFPLVHALGAALVDHALGVAEDDIVGLEAHRLEQFDAGDRGGPGAVNDEPGRLDVAAGQVERVDQACGGDDRGAVLVVMEDRDVHQFAQALLDDEAFRRLDVLEIDAAEGWTEIAHGLDELVGILGVHLEIDRIDVCEALEQDRLAFHHRLGGERAEIAETENGSAVRDHRDQIGAGGVVIGAAVVLGDGEDRHRDTRRIGQ